jgi:hypothetical protein
MVHLDKTWPFSTGTSMAASSSLAMEYNYVCRLLLHAGAALTPVLNFTVWQITALDELKTDYRNPIDQSNTLHPLILPEYAPQPCAFFCVIFLWWQGGSHCLSICPSWHIIFESIWVDWLWADQDSMTLQTIWMQIFQHTVRKKDGAN